MKLSRFSRLHFESHTSGDSSAMVLCPECLEDALNGDLAEQLDIRSVLEWYPECEKYDLPQDIECDCCGTSRDHRRQHQENDAVDYGSWSLLGGEMQSEDCIYRVALDDACLQCHSYRSATGSCDPFSCPLTS